MLIWYPFEFLKIKSPEFVLILFGITYLIFASFNVGIRVPTIFAFALLPLVIYKTGKLSIGLFRTEKNILLFLSTTLFALSFLFMYSILSTYLNEGIISSRTAEIKFYSRAEEVSGLSATLVGLHIVPLMVFMPLYFFQRTGQLTKYFFVGSFLTILAIMVTSLVATRSPIVILSILLLINFYYGFKKVKNSSKAVMIVLFFAIIYSVSVFDFANFELTSFLYERMVSDDLSEAGSRAERWMEGINNIFEYPLGGESKRIGHFHNLWLDLRYEAGVVPMMFLMVLSLYFTYSCWRVINSLLFSIQMKAFLGSVYLVLFLMMFMEPVIQGSFVFFLYYIFFGGVLTALKDIIHNTLIL
ncbi:MAG: hypothetical protein FJZ43_03605 [Candidatus Staskawiczbacteria bacterium]|nr:hypothetical protein [Candidatus Staskawiczbacteria bacterium]